MVSRTRQAGNPVSRVQLMHPYDILLTISIGVAAGYVAAIHVKTDTRLTIAHMVVSQIGAFAFGLLGQAWLPVHEKFGLIFGAIAGAGGMCLLAWWWRAKRGKPPV